MRSNHAEALCALGRGEEALAIIEPALAEFRELGDRSCEGNALFLRSWAQRASGDPEAAACSIRDALSIADDENNQTWHGYWSAESARVELTLGRPETALRLFQESATVQRKLGDAAREAIALDGAGEACQSLHRFREAADLHRRAAHIHRRLDTPWQLANALAHLADALTQLDGDEPAHAAREEALHLLGAFDDREATRLAEQVARRPTTGPEGTTRQDG